MAAVEWFYELNGFRRGPVTPASLKQLADSGEITPETRIWREGLSDWAKASAVRGLFAAASLTATPIQSAAPAVASPVSQPTPQQPDQQPTSKPPSIPDAEWYYSIRGAQVGPVSTAVIQQLANSGHLSRGDLVWNDSLPDWVAAASVRGLCPKPSGPPPLPSEVSQLAPQVEAAAKATFHAASNVVQSVSLGKPIAGFHVQRIGLGVSSLLGVLSTFLPWVTVPVVGTIYGSSCPDGWITLALFVPALVLTFLGDRISTLVPWQQYVAAVPAGLAGATGIYKWIDFGSRMKGAQEEAGDSPLAQMMAMAVTNNVRLGIGLYVLILAGAAAVAAVFLLKGNRRGIA